MTKTMGYFVYQDKIFYTEDVIFSDNYQNKEMIKTIILGIAKSKFTNLNVLSCEDDFGKNLIGLLFEEDGYIIFNKFNLKLNMSAGDVIIFLSDFEHETFGYNSKYMFAYTNKKEIFGTGNKLFEVIATIRDEYRIKVLADNDDDAIKQANTIPISEWEHPTLEKNLQDRQIIRHARWGNLRAEEQS